MEQPAAIARRLTPGVAWLLLGVIIGLCLRPPLGAAWRHWRSEPDGPAPPRLPQLHEARTEQFRLLDPVAEPGSIVYLGDSITDWVNLDEFVHSERAAILDRSISGDTTAGVLERIEHTFPPRASVCIALVGLNDLSHGDSAEAIAARIQRIVSVLIERHGVRHVVVESLLPTSEPLNSDIRRLNAMLAVDFATVPAVSFLDLYPLFLAGDEPDPTLFAGDVHLNARGMKRRLQREVEHLARVAPDVELRLRPTID